MALEKEFSNRGISELWSTKGNRHRLLIVITAGLFSQTAGSGIVSYYIFLVLDQIGITDSNSQLILNGCLTIFNMCIATGMAFTVDKFGKSRVLASAATSRSSFRFQVLLRYTEIALIYNILMSPLI